MPDSILALSCLSQFSVPLLPNTVYCAVEIFPLPFDANIGLVHPPASTH